MIVLLISYYHFFQRERIQCQKCKKIYQCKCSFRHILHIKNTVFHSKYPCNLLLKRVEDIVMPNLYTTCTQCYWHFSHTQLWCICCTCNSSCANTSIKLLRVQFNLYHLWSIFVTLTKSTIWINGLINDETFESCTYIL